MSELINIQLRRGVRWNLLTSVSATALLVAACASESAGAEESGKPAIWIELGTQVEKIEGGEQPYSPAFLDVGHNPNPWDSIGPATIQRPARYSIGGEGSISYNPNSSDWMISASIRYGRSNSFRAKHAEDTQLLPNAHSAQNHAADPDPFAVYADGRSKAGESHTIVDFSVGKDVGFGVFGHDGDSVVNIGVRFAQFEARSKVNLYGWPGASGLQYGAPPKYQVLPTWNQYQASANVAHSFHGIGPSVSWKASAPVAGVPDSAEFTLDWGINAAVLFGRQKVNATHKTIIRHHYYTGTTFATPSHTDHGNSNRSRSVMIPNVGGFAALSLKFPNAKVSLGYRADLFFGAMDGGFDARKTYDRNFYGPFASVSIGLGG